MEDIIVPKRKPRLTYDEHIDYGRRLKSIRKELMSLTTPLLGEKYPQNSPTARVAKKAMDSIDALRCKMDDNLAEEHPNKPYERVYYGPDNS